MAECVRVIVHMCLRPISYVRQCVAEDLVTKYAFGLNIDQFPFLSYFDINLHISRYLRIDIPSV
jgi:hypothetical protein